jgi:hypothetical protein
MPCEVKGGTSLVFKQHRTVIEPYSVISSSTYQLLNNFGLLYSLLYQCLSRVIHVLNHLSTPLLHPLQRASAISPENSIVPNTIDMALQPSREVQPYLLQHRNVMSNPELSCSALRRTSPTPTCLQRSVERFLINLLNSIQFYYQSLLTSHDLSLSQSAGSCHHQGRATLRHNAHQRAMDSAQRPVASRGRGPTSQ